MTDTPKIYLLIVSDTLALSEGLVSAATIALDRLERSIWPLYKSTSFASRIAPGDHCLIYIAGHKRLRGTVIAEATVSEVKTFNGRRSAWFEHETMLATVPDRVMSLVDIHVFHQPVVFRDLVAELEITKFTTKNWGAFMQGGAKMLTQHDYKKIKAKGNQ